MYSCLIILNSILAFSYSYLLVDKNESLSLIFAENNHGRRAVAIYPPNWNFTTVSPDDLPPYNKYLQPGKPRLTFGFHIEQMRTVSEIEKIFSFDAIATASWIDPRLPNYLSISQDSWRWTDELELKIEILDDIWHPDIDFDPLVSVEESEAGSKVFLGQNGEIRVEKFGRYTFSCEMNLLYFPFDRHKCQIVISAYKIDIDLSIMFNKLEQQFSMKPDQVIGNLQFDDLDVSRDHEISVAGVVEYTLYMQHALFLRMKRNPMFYTLTLFVPNTVLTTLSWVVLWVDPAALPERASICIALILAQTILIIGEEQSFPQSADFKIIDAYLIVNFMMNVASLVETLMASCAIKKMEAKKTQLQLVGREDKKATGNKPKNESSVDDVYDNNNETNAFEPVSNPTTSRNIEVEALKNNSILKSTVDTPDRISRIMFPLAFLTWNVLFFVLSKHFADKAYDDNDLQPIFSQF